MDESSERRLAWNRYVQSAQPDKYLPNHLSAYTTVWTTRHL